MPDYNFQNPGINCGLLDTSNINAEKISNNNTTWVACEVDPKLYLHTPYGELVPRPHALITFNEPCFATVCNNPNQLNTIQGMQFFFRNTLIKNANNNQNPNTNSTQPNPVSSVNDIKQAAEGALGEAGKSVDAASINNMEFQPAAVYPAAAVVPMISNLDSYGPWVSSNFSSFNTNEGSYGGLSVEVNPDLVPWNYGNSIILNAIGETLVENNNIGLTRQENGSFSVPGLPQQTTNLGQIIGTYGPLLTSINFTYGNNVTTSYEFKTYTPKFGRLAKLYIDKFKKIASKRREMVRFLKIQTTNQYRSNRRFVASAIKQQINKQAASKQASLQRAMIGEIYNFHTLGQSASQRTVVGTSTLDKTSVEMMYDYNKKAYMSMDGLWGPVSINGDGELPRFSEFFIDTDKQSLPRNPYPPFQSNNHTINNLRINKDYLNPLTNKVNNANHHHSGNGCGHNIDLVGREEDIPEDGMLRSFYSINDDDRYSNDYRFLAMRGPLVLHSWGYDTDGKPIPNESDNDNDAKTGTFITDNLKDRFLKDWLGKPATWPVAPIDLRFDRNRAVWVAPPSPSIIVARLDAELSANSFCEASILFDDVDENPIYDKDGNLVTDGKITVYDKLGCNYNKDTKIYAYFNTCFNKYIVLEACGSDDNDNYCPPTDPSDSFTIGKLDLQTIPGWNKTVEQVLGHDETGCLKWIDTTECETSPPVSTP